MKSYTNTNGKPPIHLWIYNHPFCGISDQVEFFLTLLNQHNYPVTIGRKPNNQALNVVIENFSEQSSNILVNFCRSTGKRVSIIMTEHLDFDTNRNEILIHGDPLWTKNDYMPPETQVSRIRYLLDCLPYYRSFLVLGDLPELNNLSVMIPGITARKLPFFKLDYIEKSKTDTKQLKNDLLFTGNITDYRSYLLNILKQQDINVHFPQKFVSKKMREVLMLSSKVILNIPQRSQWHWLSLMRIISGLRIGRASISLDTSDLSQISCCCPQLDINSRDWISEINDSIDNWYEFYCKAYDNYTSMAHTFEQANPFPHDLFDYWAITDKIKGFCKF